MAGSPKPTDGDKPAIDDGSMRRHRQVDEIMSSGVVTQPNSTATGAQEPSESGTAVLAEEYTEEYFTLLARRYLLSDGWSQQRVRDIVHLVRPEAGEQILDMGCGVGVTAIEAAKRGAVVLAVDYAAPAIRAARRLEAVVLGGTHIQFAQADGGRLPVADGAVDKIAAVDFVEHITGHQFKAFAFECSRVLRTGGKLLVYTPNPLNLIRDAHGRFTAASAGPTGGGNHRHGPTTLMRGARHIWRYVGLPLLIRPFLARSCDGLPLLFPVVADQRMIDADARYDHLHVDMKPASYLRRVLGRAGLRCCRVSVTRSPWWLSSLPYPVGASWGGWLAATFEKASSPGSEVSQG